MKARMFRSYRMKMMLYTVFSAVITISIDAILLAVFAKMNLWSKQRANSLNDALDPLDSGLAGAGNNLANTPAAGGLQPGDSFPMSDPQIFGYRFKWLTIIILILVSIVVFVVIFHLLTRKTTAYIEEITKGIQRITEGDYYTSIDVKYDDEFTIIAENLNIMALDLRLLKEKENEAESTKNELITNVAHDLRTPLTSIIGYLDILNTNKMLTGEQKDRYIDIAYNKSKRLEKLINDLFSFTKISYGKMPMEAAPIDIIKLLEQQIDEFYPSFEDNNLSCEFRPYENSTLVMGDGQQLARVFENLISNAIRYGKDGKVVKIITKKEIEYLRIVIINYGSVIPQEDLPYVFDKFYRVEQSRQEDTGGTGLGLSIAKAIVEAHNGVIEARSTLSGTAFEVRLKIATDVKI